MTTPQDPNQPLDPNQPVDPNPPVDPNAPVDPNQPYGQPPQYGTPQYGAPQYGQPQAPQYGQPQYGAGQPGVPYGAPMPPQGGEQQPSKAMAITSLVLAVLGCFAITWLVSVVLAIIVLVKGKDGRAHGKGLAIAALVIDALYVLALIAVVVIAVVVGPGTTVDDLKTGDCITASGLSDNSDTVDSIKVVNCTTSHDGEVLFTKSLSQDEADSYSDDGQNAVCVTGINADPTLQQKMSSDPGLTVLALSQSLPPDPGDKVACVAYHDDGSKLSGPLG
jgi:hypothetical protein